MAIPKLLLGNLRPVDRDETIQPEWRFTGMHPSRFPLSVILAAALPVLAVGADSKRPQRPAARPDSATAEVMKTFDTNGNQQIDADELPAVQKAFEVLKKLDKNDNGEIELAEVERPKAPAADGRRERMLAGFREVDKNSNRKIDDDEIEALQKVLKGGQIMSKLDQNGNGKLEASEVARLNERLAQGLPGRSGKSAAPPASTFRRPPEVTKPAPEAPKAEEKKPAESFPAKKAPGNFGS